MYNFACFTAPHYFAHNRSHLSRSSVLCCSLVRSQNHAKLKHSMTLKSLSDALKELARTYTFMLEQMGLADAK